MKNFGRESRVFLYKRRFFIIVIVITVLYCAYNRVTVHIALPAPGAAGIIVRRIVLSTNRLTDQLTETWTSSFLEHLHTSSPWNDIQVIV